MSTTIAELNNESNDPDLSSDNNSSQISQNDQVDQMSEPIVLTNSDDTLRDEDKTVNNTFNKLDMNPILTSTPYASTNPSLIDTLNNTNVIENEGATRRDLDSYEDDFRYFFGDNSSLIISVNKGSAENEEATRQADYQFLFGPNYCRSFKNSETQTTRQLRRHRRAPVRFGYARRSQEKLELDLLKRKLSWERKKTRRFSSLRHPTFPKTYKN